MVRADEGRVRISDVQVGFGGLLKVGVWTPVRAEFAGPAGETFEPRLVAPDPDGSETVWPLPAVTLNAAGTATTQGMFQLGRLGGNVRLEAAGSHRVLSSDDVVADGGSGALRARRQSVRIVGLLGPADGFVQAFAADGPAGGTPAQPAAEILEFASPDDLPETAQSLAALDVLVMAGVFGLDATRSGAVAEWVATGGHLVLMLGTDEPAFRASPLAAWLPCEVSGIGTFRDLAAIADRVQHSPPLPANRGTKGMRIEMPSGKTLISSLDGPIAARGAYGLGRVTVCAIDWQQPPLVKWEGLPGLCRYLSDLIPAGEQSPLTTSASQLRPTGVSDLATQLAGQLDHFDAVTRPSYWTVLGFVGLFLLLAGPLDYLLVQRWLRRPQWTWATFPAWVALGAVCGTLYAGSHNLSRQQANQFDLVDLDAPSGLMRVRSWLNVHSPAPRRYAVAADVAEWLAGAPGGEGPRMTWSGAPESGFRGMYRQGGLNLANPSYEFEPDLRGVKNLPIDQWSTQALTTSWERQSPESLAALVESDLRARGNTLEGSLTHHLPGPLMDWCLVYGSLVYLPTPGRTLQDTGGLLPGQTWTPDRVIQPRVLTGYLTGTAFRASERTDRHGSNAVQSHTVYDPLVLDTLVFARTLTFHSAAGGTQYTSLTNQSLERWDLSRLLDLNRAVLFGRLQPAAATYTVDGGPVTPERRTTFVRVVLPVRPSTREAERTVFD